MKIIIKVKPGAKEERVEKVKDNEFAISIKAPPKEGRANEAAIELLSEYFSVPKSRIRIIKGFKCKNKIIDL